MLPWRRPWQKAAAAAVARDVGDADCCDDAGGMPCGKQLLLLLLMLQVLLLLPLEGQHAEDEALEADSKDTAKEVAKRKAGQAARRTILSRHDSRRI